VNIKKDLIIPIVVLSLICLFVSGALAIVNYFTEPVIKLAADERAKTAMKEIIPQADGFIILEIDNLPKTVTSVYESTNNSGYIFMVSSQGYGTEAIKLICGIDLSGRVIKSAVLSHNETQGLGTPVFENPHASQYWGKEKSGIENIEVISGATITSRAYKNAIRDAFIAYEIVTSDSQRSKP